MGRPTPSPPAWHKTYQDLDSGALLSLVPVLVAQIERTKAQLEAMPSPHTFREQVSQEVTGHLERAMSLREMGIDVSEYVAKSEEFRQHMESSQDSHERWYRAVFVHLIDLESRRKWIIEVEAPRRGLLPALGDLPPTPGQPPAKP